MSVSSPTPSRRGRPDFGLVERQDLLCCFIEHHMTLPNPKISVSRLGTELIKQLIEDLKEKSPDYVLRSSKSIKKHIKKDWTDLITWSRQDSLYSGGRDPPTVASAEVRSLFAAYQGLLANHLDSEKRAAKTTTRINGYMEKVAATPAGKLKAPPVAQTLKAFFTRVEDMEGVLKRLLALAEQQQQ
eukprot:gnl/Dysnectes_brevis/4670_a6385_734.p1 GENE.gnl/Dysnectes_brevis/4670_a6385_734~~gnl/Dysnectes_brevis/4670_a6385_734.p1  ORF type:complete len:186 (+),score=8.93 gnl/Dysnectes_brevis/4670_a6385_734:92-649(+)